MRNVDYTPNAVGAPVTIELNAGNSEVYVPELNAVAL
jgi:hypothetical protein